MRPTSSSSLLALSSLLFALPQPSLAFHCADIQAGGVKFDFGKLGGPHVVHWEDAPDWGNEQQYRYNFTLDLCNKLKWHKGGSSKTECHHGARVCAFRELVDLTGEHNSTITPIDIAGTYSLDSGHKIDAQFELLRNSKSNSDVAREGVRAELHGGRFPFNDKKQGLDQRAIIEFVCDRKRTGLDDTENDDLEKQPDKDGDKDSNDGDDGDDGDDDKSEGKVFRVRDEGSGKCEDNDHSLRFCGYEVEELPKKKEVKTLRLEWRTKYACEDASNDVEGSHWGFFTWFIIIVFLATAAYLIFGSWLNYNRYGARGWDLLPHGDTIRDVPYILKDWARRLMDTVQGPGSRGGYSAV